MFGHNGVGLTVEDCLALGTYVPCPGRTDTRILEIRVLCHAGSSHSSA